MNSTEQESFALAHIADMRMKRDAELTAKGILSFQGEIDCLAQMSKAVENFRDRQMTDPVEIYLNYSQKRKFLELLGLLSTLYPFGKESITSMEASFLNIPIKLVNRSFLSGFSNTKEFLGKRS